MRLTILLLAFLALMPAAAVAQSGTLTRGGVEEAAATLRSERVYVDPGADGALSSAEIAALRERIETSGRDVYLAVFPRSGQRAEELAGPLFTALDRPGSTLGVISGGRFVANGRAGRSAVAAALREGNSAPEVLTAFVDRLTSGRSGGSGGSGGDAGGSGLGLLALLGVGAAGFGAYSVVRSRRRRRQQDAELEELRQVATEDLTALGDDLRTIELDVEMPTANPRSKQLVAEAVEGYGRANTSLQTARTPEDFEPIGKELEEARYDMAAAKALVAGEPEPER
nr:hypothetical protein [Solirubrobacterales bacterium]